MSKTNNKLNKREWIWNGKLLFMPRKLLVGKGKRKHTKKPNGLVPLGINLAIRQLFYFLFPCWFTPKGNWNKAISGLLRKHLEVLRR